MDDGTRAVEPNAEPAKVDGRAWRTVRVTLLALAVVVVVGAAAVRPVLVMTGTYYQPDEEIPIQVATRMLAENSLDTNWALAEVRPDFRYPQYNFSAYIAGSAAVLYVADKLDDLRAQPVAPTPVLRLTSSLLGAAAVLLTFVLARRLASTRVALGSAAFVGVSPLLIQDSLYARPETFMTALTLLLALCALGRSRRWHLAAGFTLGLLVATKVSMVALAPLLILGVVADSARRRDARTYVSIAGWAGLGTAAGFAVGAPYAVMNPSVFAHGVAMLSQQYGTGHGVHGLPEGSMVERALYSLDYFASTHGVVVFAAFVAGAVASFRVRGYRLTLIALVVAVFAARFSTYAAFFERNLSHVIPLLAIVGVAGVWAVASLVEQRIPHAGVPLFAIVLGVALITPALTSAKLILRELSGRAAGEVARLEDQIVAQHGSPIRQLAQVDGRSFEALERQVTDTCVDTLQRFDWMHDEGSAASFQRLVRHEDLRIVATHRSTFSNVPTSTLHTYFFHINDRGPHRPTTKYFTHKAADTSPRCEQYLRDVVPLGQLGGQARVDAAKLQGAPAPAAAFGKRDPRPLLGPTVLWSSEKRPEKDLTFEIGLTPDSDCRPVAVPIRTDPVASGISVTVEPEGGSAQRYLVDPTNLGWTYFRLPHQSECGPVSLTVHDESVEPDNFIAVGTPRHVTTPSAP